ncbi:MAG: PilZ domain-containing protein [Cocleimonas sp.]|nr:PilZ domain-containing protein [Cocleimonas sp.]
MENKQRNVLPLTIQNKTSLHAAYMPFLKGGGLFVPTYDDYQFGDEVIVVTSIIYLDKKIAIPGKIVWITPKSGVNNQQGVGVKFFGPTQVKIKLAIESILGELAKKPALNHNY